MNPNDEYVRSMTERFPWMHSLSPADRQACATEIMEASSASTDQVSSVITSWRETAEAIAAGRRDAPVEWLDVEEPVERPET